MRALAILLAVTVGATALPAGADFQLEMSGEEVRQAFGRRAVEDLQVGETASVRSLNTCAQDGGLYLYTMLGIEPVAPGSAGNFTVTRLPDRRVSIEVTSADGGAHAIRQMIMSAVGGAHLRTCRVAGIGEDQVFRVTTINGLSSDREVFGSEQ